MSYSRGSLRQKHRRWGTCCKITVTIENCFSTDLSLSLGRGKLPHHFQEHFEICSRCPWKVCLTSAEIRSQLQLLSKGKWQRSRRAVRRLLCHFLDRFQIASYNKKGKEKERKEVSCSLRHNFLEHGATQSSKVEIYNSWNWGMEQKVQKTLGWLQHSTKFLPSFLDVCRQTDRLRVI